MSVLTYAESVPVASSPEALYDVTRSQVVVAERGTLVTESWQFLPDGVSIFAQRYGEDAQRQIADRTRAAHEGIPLTLAAVTAIAETG